MKLLHNHNYEILFLSFDFFLIFFLEINKNLKLLIMSHKMTNKANRTNKSPHRSQACTSNKILQNPSGNTRSYSIKASTENPNERKLSSEQVKEYTELFNKFDKNGDGRISMKELAVAMRMKGIKLSCQELKDIVELIDNDSNGSIELNEFIEFIEFIMFSSLSEDNEEIIRAAFRLADKDQNGFISAEEIKDFMINIGEPSTDEEILLLINDADVDGDGQIDYEGKI